MQLHEQYRPKDWSEVVGQPKALATIERLRQRGLAGRAYWLSGASGTGKTTIAKLLAAEVADDLATIELDAKRVTPADLDDLERKLSCHTLGKGGWAILVNEAHGLRDGAIKQLLVMLERLPNYVIVVFTTTNDGEESLFDDCADAHPLLSRCSVVPLTRRDLAKGFAERAKAIAEREGLGGDQPIERYVKLVYECKLNLREVLQLIEGGELLNSPARVGKKAEAIAA